MNAADSVTPAAVSMVSDMPAQAETGCVRTDPVMECCPTEACCPSVWTVNAGAIFLSRNRATAQPSGRIQTLDQRQVFDMADSDLGTAVGPDISLSRSLGACWDVQARFFQVDGWNDRNDFQDYGTTMITGYGASMLAPMPSVSYSSRLYNVETNLRWKGICHLPVLAGFRTLGLDENFQVSVAGGENVSVANTSTNNALYGCQIGIEPVLWDQGGRFRLESSLKAGIYGNRTHQRTFLGGQQFDSRSDGVPSYVGEIGVFASYALNKCWSLRAGYEVMWITNVALAPDQLSSVNYGVPPTGAVYDKATAFYHGATAGVERRF
jgi:hypothetical protein